LVGSVSALDQLHAHAQRDDAFLRDVRDDERSFLRDVRTGEDWLCNVAHTLFGHLVGLLADTVPAVTAHTGQRQQ
jgi:hypothetical protein